MSDHSVEREIEANEQRANDGGDNDDGSVVDSMENTVNPLTSGLGTDLGGDDGDDVDPDQQRRLNDAEQRPS
jgi:hypothetical protein